MCERRHMPGLHCCAGRQLHRYSIGMMYELLSPWQYARCAFAPRMWLVGVSVIPRLLVSCMRTTPAAGLPQLPGAAALTHSEPHDEAHVHCRNRLKLHLICVAVQCCLHLPCAPRVCSDTCVRLAP